MLTLHLDTLWSCDYIEVEPDLYEFQDYATQVPSLPDWRFSGRYPEGWAAWLERRFDLQPTDMCVRYTLRIEATPDGAALSVNGRQFGVIDAPCSVDVTDYVTLDENRIAFRVLSGANGAFGALRLTAVPCEE
jgi:hypothetical protein